MENKTAQTKAVRPTQCFCCHAQPKELNWSNDREAWVCLACHFKELRCCRQPAQESLAKNTP